jgi:hypothetical protein
LQTSGIDIENQERWPMAALILIIIVFNSNLLANTSVSIMEKVK